ncbi:class I SAM-dependent methyltransferase [bacterium]|nr:class I SAM-dependent methyltransferase [candidate division CSSED10-310 bacterium]
MEAEIFRNMDAEGQNYWWYRGKKGFVRGLLHRAGLQPSGRVLDLGCGTGTLFEFLEGWGQVVGMELSRDALILAKSRSDVPLVRATTDAIPFKPGRFALIAVFDCLEHLQDDARALIQARNLLAPGGILIVSVPAFRFLASWRDIQLDHMRRYTRSGLNRLLENAGFIVNQTVYGYFCLFFPLILKALKDRFVDPPEVFKSDINNLSEPWNTLLAKWLYLEAWISTRIGLPFGTSLFCLARPKEVDPG